MWNTYGTFWAPLLGHPYLSNGTKTHLNKAPNYKQDILKCKLTKWFFFYTSATEKFIDKKNLSCKSDYERIFYLTPSLFRLFLGISPSSFKESSRIYLEMKNMKLFPLHNRDLNSLFWQYSFIFNLEPLKYSFYWNNSIRLLQELPGNTCIWLILQI